MNAIHVFVLLITSVLLKYTFDSYSVDVILRLGISSAEEQLRKGLHEGNSENIEYSVRNPNEDSINLEKR